MRNYKKLFAKACAVMMLGTSYPITTVTYAEEIAPVMLILFRNKFKPSVVITACDRLIAFQLHS